MSTLWPWPELNELFSCNLDGDPVTGVSIDTRTLNPGDMFIALVGEGDGHDFVEKAVAGGASCVMAHKECDVDVPVIQVDGTLDGLWRLGRAARSRSSARVVAITGSSGKTTLRLWLQTLLSNLGRTHASEHSYNNHWGVPLSLARMPAETEFGVFEIGTNHPGEIKPLSELVSPEVALLLNVLPAHIGNFEDMEQLVEEKLSIVAGLQDNGIAVLPIEFANRYQGPVKSFGDNPDADVKGNGVPEGEKLSISADVCGTAIEVTIPFQGEHRLSSVLATLAVLNALGVDMEQLKSTFTALAVPKGRGQVEVKKGVTIIDDSYNANPVSMKLAIRALADTQTNGRKIALLGEMLELGDGGPAAHREVATSCDGIDTAYTFGEGFDHVVPSSRAHQHFEKVGDFDIDDFAKSLEDGDTVLVKGSNKVFWLEGFTDRLKEKL